MSKQAEQIEHVAPQEQSKESKAQEIASLKSRLDLMGITYHHSLGVKKLRALVAQGVEEEGAPKKAVIPAPLPEDVGSYVETVGARRARLRREASALIRIVVTCMNPEKRDWDGEQYSVGNSVVGQFKKYVPFNVEAGYHVPQIILNHMLEKQCQIWVNKVNERGEKVKKGKLINELNIQILPSLTAEELRALGQRQAMSHSIDE